jgi:prefoldin beta subunit
MAEQQLSEEMKHDIQEFQGLQQQLQFLMMQRQQVAVQASEAQKAEEEVNKAKKGEQMYRYVGTVMVPKKQEDLAKELKEEREKSQVYVSTLQKQEDKVRERMEALKKKIEAKLPKAPASAQAGASS